MVDVVVDGGGDRGQQDRRRADGQDHEAHRVDIDEQRRDRPVGPGQGHDREGRRGPGRDQGQVGLGYGVGQAGGPGVQRDGPEAHGHGQGHGQVGQTEDHRLGGQLGQVATDPGRGRDGHRAGHRGGPQGAHADGRPDPAAAGRHGQQRPDDATRGRRQDGQAGVGQGQGQARGGQQGEGHGRGVAAAAGGRGDDRQEHAAHRAQDQEQAQERGRGQPHVVDAQDVAGIDEQGGHDRTEQGRHTDRGGQPFRAPREQREHRPDARDQQERQQAHGRGVVASRGRSRSSSGWASGARRTRMGASVA